MEKDLFLRLKKLLKKEGKIVVVNENGKDAFIMQSLDDYENSSCECDYCNDENFRDDEWDDETDDFDFDDINDEELMKKVNADIAKWREDQKPDEAAPAAKEVKVEEPQEKTEEVLSEEEKYYLEPLE